MLPNDYDPELSWRHSDDLVGVAELAGLVLDEWQDYAAEALTLTRANGRRAATEVFLAANRQNGKGSIIEARQLYGLFVAEEPLQLYSAHRFNTAIEMFSRIKHLIEECPKLASLVSHVSESHGKEEIVTKKNCRLKFVARSENAIRGFTGNTLYLDEAYDLSEKQVGAMVPALAAKSMSKNLPQIIYASSAGLPRSEKQFQLRERAFSANPGAFAYLEWSVPGWHEMSAGEQAAWPNQAAWRADPEIHRLANPAYNIRIAPEFVAETELESMGEEEFERERLGVWARIGGESTIPDGWWTNCGADGALVEDVETVAFAIDVPPDRSMASICMAGRMADGRIGVVLIDRREGLDWVPERLRELRDRWKPVGIFMDAAGAAGSLLPDLKRARVRPRTLTRREYAQGAGRMFDMIRDGSMAHTGQVELADAVRVITKKILGDSLFIWARTDTLTDISPFVGITLAAAGLTLKEKRTERSTGLRGKVVWGNG